MFKPGSNQGIGDSPRLHHVLNRVAEDVVNHLGCVVAVVATLTPDSTIEVQAYAQNGPAMTPTFVRGRSTKGFADLLNVGSRRRSVSHQVSNGDGDAATTYVLSDSLYELLRPAIEKTTAARLQEELGISQAVAVPFWLDEEMAGNLIAATTTEFAERDIDFLMAFGRQAAAGVQSQRQLDAMGVLERVILALQSMVVDETQVQQAIVDAVVNDLGYAGAMVATLEPGDQLPVRAYNIDIASDLLRQFEARAGMSLVGPNAVVLLDDPRHKENLSVRAVRGDDGKPKKYVTSPHLYDLLRPFIPKALADVMQRIIAVRQVIAVPFLMADEVVGNLFVATHKSSFSSWEVSLLTAFGQQAAVGIRNARLYREANEHRQVAEMFGRMAFSATASIHNLRNHISAASTYLDLIYFIRDNPEQVLPMLGRTADLSERLRKAIDILDHLHEPWQQARDSAVSVNDALRRAVREVFPELLLADNADHATIATGISLHFDLTDGLPPIYTSLDMLAEAFRILIKNGTEALLEAGGDLNLWLTSRLNAEGQVEVSVRDSGTGIKPENLYHIFRMGWSTKKGQGMGFGLFWTRDFITGLGGDITVKSIWGEGTTFYIYLPVTAVPD